MPITKDAVTGALVFTAPNRGDLFVQTGVANNGNFAICDKNDSIKQIKFDPGSQTTNTTVTLASGASTVNTTLTLPANSGTFSTAAFKTFQTPSGTSPVAASPTDTLTLTSSDNSVTITGSASTDTIDFKASAGTGTVTSVALSMPAEFSVANSPITASGTLAVTAAAQSQNLFYASPNGSSGAATFRSIVAADVPTLNQNTSGTALNITASSNTTLTSLSNLVTVGTIGTGVWSGAAILETKGGTNQTTYAKGDTLYASATNTLSKLTVGTSDGTMTSGQILGVGSTGIPAWKTFDYNTGATVSELRDDFTTNSSSGDTGWGASGSGGTAGVLAGTVGHPGIVQLSTGTGTTGREGLLRAANPGGIILGGGQFLMIGVIRFATQSDVTNTYTLRFGLGDSLTGDFANGVYFVYDQATNGNFWALRTASGSSFTTTVCDGGGGRPTLAATGGDWLTAGFVVNAAASSVQFYAGLNGAALTAIGSAITGTIPTTAIGPIYNVIKSAGGTARTADIDFYYHRLNLTTARWS